MDWKYLKNTQLWMFCGMTLNAFFCYNFVVCSPLPTETTRISVFFCKRQKFTKCSLCLFWGQFNALAATSMHSSDTVGIWLALIKLQENACVGGFHHLLYFCLPQNTTSVAGNNCHRFKSLTRTWSMQNNAH